jgi:hypothetical protein
MPGFFLASSSCFDYTFRIPGSRMFDRRSGTGGDAMAEKGRTMRQAGTWLALALLAGMAAGCAPLAVEQDYDTTYDFTKLRTYDWLPSPPGDQMEEMTEKRVQGAVDAQLQAKRYSRETVSPDFKVSVEGVKKTVSGGTVAVGASVGVPMGRHGSLSVGTGKAMPREKQEGTLTVNIVEGQSGTVIWQGSASAAIREKVAPEEQQQRINQVIAELLKTFPPGKKQ